MDKNGVVGVVFERGGMVVWRRGFWEERFFEDWFFVAATQKVRRSSGENWTIPTSNTNTHTQVHFGKVKLPSLVRAEKLKCVCVVCVASKRGEIE